MKKLALLLGSLLVVGATASAKEIVAPVEAVVYTPAPMMYTAAPVLSPVSLNFYYENDNTSFGNSALADERFKDYREESGNYGLNYFGSEFKFKSENWNYALAGYKAWNYDSDEGEGFAGSRIQVTAMRDFNKDGEFNYSIGTRVRMQNNYDRYYLMGSYSYGMFSGNGYVGYTSVHSGPDYLYSEVTPLAVTMYGVKLSYIFENSMYVGENGKDMDKMNHELRLSFPLYTSDKFNAGFEYRFGILGTDERLDDVDVYGAGDFHGFMLSADYQLTANSTINTYYLYEMTLDVAEMEDTNKYYGEFLVGWTYKF